MVEMTNALAESNRINAGIRNGNFSADTIGRFLFAQ